MLLNIVQYDHICHANPWYKYKTLTDNLLLNMLAILSN